jgi:hypothetical protein
MEIRMKFPVIHEIIGNSLISIVELILEFICVNRVGERRETICETSPVNRGIRVEWFVNSVIL